MWSNLRGLVCFSVLCSVVSDMVGYLAWCGVWHVVVSGIVSGAVLCLMCCGLFGSGGQTAG